MTGVMNVAGTGEARPDSGELLDVIRSRRLSYLTSVVATVGSRFVSRFTSLVLIVVAARFISIESFGAYSYLVSLAITFSVLANIGVAPVVARRVAAGTCSAREGLRAGMPIALLTFGGLAVVVATVAWLTTPSGGGVAAAACFVGAYVVVTGPLDLNCAVLRAVGRTKWEATVHVVSAFFFALLALPIMIWSPSIVGLLGAFAAKEAIGLVVSVALLRRALPTANVVRNHTSLPRREMLASGIVVSLSAVGAAVLLRAPLQILGNVATSRDVAFFSVAARVADVWVLLGATLGLALFPFVARRHRQSGGQSVFRREVAYTTLGAMLVGALAGVALPRLVPIMFGAEYARSATIAAVVALAAPLYVLPSVLRQFLIAAGHEMSVLGAHLVGLGALAGLAPVTIPRWGVDGAVIALCGSFAVLTASLIVVGARTERWN